MVRSIVVLLALALPVAAAPVPFPKASRARPLTRDGLIGTWTVHWGTVPATFMLSANGDYSCHWPGTKYVGSWGLDRDGRLWITESNHPESPSSWQSYAIRLNADSFATCRAQGTLIGPVEVGATGVSVRLQKKR